MTKHVIPFDPAKATATAPWPRAPYPMAPATEAGMPVVCVGCGMRQPAVIQVSYYPNRFMPDGWVRGSNDAVWCDHCTQHHDFGYGFALQHHVYVKTDGGVIVEQRTDEQMAQLLRQLGYQNVNQQEEDPMADEQTGVPRRRRPHSEEEVNVKDKAKDQMKRLGGAAMLGAQLVVVDEAGEIFLDLAGEMAKDIPQLQPLLETAEGREIAKLMVALTLNSVATYAQIPKADAVQKVTELQVTASGFKLMRPRMAAMRIYFTKLAGVGEKLIAKGIVDGNLAAMERDNVRVTDDEDDEFEIDALRIEKAKQAG